MSQYMVMSDEENVAHRLDALALETDEQQSKGGEQSGKCSPSKRELVRGIAAKLDHIRDQGIHLDLRKILYRDDSHLLDASEPEQQNVFQLHLKNKTLPTPFVAIDCEMVGVGPAGRRSALARVSIVNEYGYPILDIYVQPNQKVTHWRTRWSGITPSVLEQAKHDQKLFSFHEARELVEKKIAQSTVIGHSVNSDLSVLHLRQIPPTIDTQKFPYYDEFGLHKQPGLKNALATLFNVDIQKGRQGHDSVEDAQAAMLLFRVLRPGFENMR